MYKKAICVLCTDNIVKPVIKRLCQYHYRLERMKVYAKKKQNLKSSPSEMELFNKIWETREHNCFVTEVYLGDKEYLLNTNQFHFIFHHVLRKGNYPKFKYYDKNIIMVSPDVHINIESKAMSDLIKKDKRYDKIEILYNHLKEEYYAK